LLALRIAVIPAGVEAGIEAGADFGAFDARVATIAEAVERAGAAPAEIVLAPGLHAVARTVAIGASSGVRVIEAMPGARVTGALVGRADAWVQPTEAELARFPAEARGRIRAWRLPADAAAAIAGPVHSGHGIETAAVHSELFVGERALSLARWPNEGFAEIGAIVDPGSAPRDAMDDIPADKRVVAPDRGGVFVPKDAARAARWSAAPDAWALGFWNWDWSHEQLPVAGVDASTGAVTLGLPHRYGLAARGRFFVLNVAAELDAEGEYWIDRGARTVYAWLPAGAGGAACALTACGEPLLRLDGARDLVVRGVRFEWTRGAAVEAGGCERVAFESCEFRAIGTRAIRLDGRGNRVARCVFRDVGGTGVLLSGGDRPTLARGENAVEDSVFEECGRVLRSYSPAVVVEGVGNRVSHCAIRRHPHIALWFRGNDHLVEANEFAEVVYETGDAGAVYCGRDWTAQGTVIRGNLFRDIRGSDARFQNGVYLDDMASGIAVEDNTFVRCNWGVLVGGGRDVTLRRNTFAACAKAVSWDARGVGWMAEQLRDPQSSTLLRRYAEMPVESEPWKSRYPHLGDYLSFDFGRPVRGVLADTRLVATPLGRIDDRERVIESGTVREPVEGAAIEARVAEILASMRSTVGPRPAAPGAK
jgi:hypothetical protein